MTRAVFVVSKQPFEGIEDGETRVTRLLLEAAAKACQVHVVALSEHAAEGEASVGLTEVPKPPVRLARLSISSVLHRRSLMHLRFAPRSLRDQLRELEADVFVARRAYMAQAAVDAGRVPPRDRLVVLADVLESSVMGRRGSALRPLYALEARRTRRDEVRCLRAASEVAYLSDTELDEVGGIVAGPRRRLDLVLPAAEQPARLDDPVAVFVGDRRWPPNAEALSRLLALWSRIVRVVPGARLLVAGRPGPREPRPEAAGVERLGFVDDLDAVWRSASVLLAPVSIGGGVRVKVLDAARHGVPVVGTPAAIGSTASYLPLSGEAADEGFVAEAAGLLGSISERRARGLALFETNRELNLEGFVEEQVASLLAGRGAEPPRRA